MLIPILLLITGLIILIFGANYLVEGSSAMAKKLNISDLAIGLTIVAFGTSAPELVVNTFAALQGHQDLVFGNVLGSNNFNLFIILGITGLITPLAVQSSTVWKEIPISFLAVVVLYFLVNDRLLFNSETSILSSLDAVVLLILFGFFIFYVYSQLKSAPGEIEIKTHHLSNLMIAIYIIGGLGGLIYGGYLVVNNAVDIAHIFGISEKIIGLTVVAAGTSLPELATSLVAALKKNADIAVGNIIGSNIFNISLILGVSGILKPIRFDPLFNVDMYILGGGTIFLFLIMFIGKKKILERWQAAILLLFYLGYMSYLVMEES